MSIQDVTLIDVPTSQFVDSIANGSVDALDVSNIYVDQIADRLGSDIIAFYLTEYTQGALYERGDPIKGKA